MALNPPPHDLPVNVGKTAVGKPEKPSVVGSVDPHRPGSGLRFVVGVLWTTFSVTVLLPTVLALMLVVGIGVVVAVAFSLGRSHDLEAGTFEVAHTAALLLLPGMLLTLSTARAYLRSTKRHEQAWALPFNAPFVSTGVLLGVAAVFLTQARWAGSPWVAPAVSATFVIASGYFVIGAGIVAAIVGAFRLAVGAHKWSTMTSYRAGLTTGALLVFLAPTAWSAWQSPKSTLPPPASLPFPSSSSIGVRETMVALYEGRNIAPTGRPAGLPATQLADLTPSNAVGLESKAADQTKWEECFAVFRAEEDSLRASIRARYRLTDDDVHDLVRDSLVSVCVAYANGAPYDRLGAVFQASVNNRANTTSRRRRYLRCAVELGDDLKCERPQPDLQVRIDQQLALLQAVLCKEDGLKQRVFYLRIHEGLDYRAIGAECGIPEIMAKDIYNNLVKKMRKRAEEACGP